MAPVISSVLDGECSASRAGSFAYGTATTVGGWVRSRAVLDVLGEKKNVPHTGIEPPIVQPFVQEHEVSCFVYTQTLFYARSVYSILL
jgi:hypothetical protein